MTNANAILLHNTIISLPDFQLQQDTSPAYEHMGALLVDAALQAGIRYDTVVRPRVEAILQGYPEAKSTSAFQRVLMLDGAANLLNWRPDRKINTLVDLTQFLVAEGVETVPELRTWLLDPANVTRLKQIKGIGDKTADLLKMEAGIPTSAIDRHIMTFLARAGIAVRSYEEAQLIVRQTAALLGIDERTLDYSIWSYMAV